MMQPIDPRRSPALVLRVAVAALIFAAGFWVRAPFGLQARTYGAQHGHEASEASGASERSASTPGKARHKPRPIHRPYLIRPLQLFEASDPEAEQRYHAQQSRELMDVLRSKVQIARRMYPDQTAEVVATPIFAYMEGMTEGLMRTAPDLADELAAQIESVMCDPQAREEDLIMFSQMVRLAPELANPRSFDCLFAQRTAGAEDSVLWFGLDAWKASGLPKTDALSAIERRATDPRTRARFLPDTVEPPSDEPSGDMAQPDPTGPVVTASTPSARGLNPPP